MNTDNICKVLYTLPEGAVTPKRESVTSQIIIALVGVVLLTINFLLGDKLAETLSMLLLTLGVGMVLYGIVVGAVRLNSAREVPYDNEAKRYMKYRERYYDRTFVAPILASLECGDIEAIDIMPTTNIAAVTLVEYRSKHRVAYGLYEYSDSEYKPIGKPKVITR